MSTAPPRIALVQDNVGPYHLARLTALAARCPAAGIEICARSSEYAWERPPTAPGPGGQTLFGQDEPAAPPVRELRRRLRDALERHAPDVVFLPGWSAAGALFGLEWCADRRVPAVCMSESHAADAPRRPLLERMKARVIRMFSAAFVAGTPQRRYIESLGMPPDRIFTGCSAVDNDYFRRGVEAIRAAAGDGVPERPRHFLVVCRFVEKKNLPFVVRAYGGYLRRARAGGSSAPRAPWKLVLAGDGALRPQIERAIDEAGIRSQVSMPGFVQYAELPALFAGAGALIHASTVEQWGLVVNEAMASSLPVLVSTRCGCATDLVIEGETGHAFEPDDAEALVERMLALWSSPEAARRMGAAGRERIDDWGLPNFVGGALRAAEAARAAAATRAGSLDRWVLRGLAAR